MFFYTLFYIYIYVRLLFFSAQTEYSYYSADLRLNMFLWTSLYYSGWHSVLMTLWRWSNFGARLQAIKSGMTHITSWKNVFAIGHTASAEFVVFRLVLPFSEKKNFCTLYNYITVFYLQLFNTWYELWRCVTQSYDRICRNIYTYLMSFSLFRSYSIRKSAYVTDYLFSTNSQSRR